MRSESNHNLERTVKVSLDIERIEPGPWTFIIAAVRCQWIYLVDVKS